MSDSSKKWPKPSEGLARLPALALQMGILIFAGVWGGRQLDSLFPNRFHAFALLLSLLAVGAAIYIAIKNLTR